MKSFVFFCVFIGLFMISCTVDDNCSAPKIEDPVVVNCNAEYARIFHPGEMQHGRVAGLKNCRPFAASAISGFKVIDTTDFDFFGLQITTYEDWGSFFANKEILIINSFATGIGSWPLLPDISEHLRYQTYHVMQDHDVFEDLYYIDTSYAFNIIHITAIDSIAKHAEGWFECRFILDLSQPSGRNPDTVLFSQCYFEAEMP